MPGSERKRPWYLVLALLGALAFGANGARSGWDTVTLYRESVDPSVAAEDISDEADRAVVVASVEAYFRAFDAAKARGWPLGAAALVLGTATLFFALRTMAGSRGARALLVQLVLAQASVSVASHWLLHDVEDAELAVTGAREVAHIHEEILEKPRADEMVHTYAKVLHAATPVAVMLEILGSLLIVVALTRRRARDFFEAAPTAIGER